MTSRPRLSAALLVAVAVVLAVLAYRAATAVPGDLDVTPVQVPPAATTPPAPDPAPAPAPQPVAPVPQPVAGDDDGDDDGSDDDGDDDGDDDDD